jgi:hypothetical protein
MNTSYRDHLIASGALWPFIACAQHLSNLTRPMMSSDGRVMVPAIDMRMNRLLPQHSAAASSRMRRAP